MTLRCSCTDDEHTVVDGGWRDPIVFGRCRSCSGDPPAQSTLPKLVPSSWFVVPAEEPEAIQTTGCDIRVNTNYSPLEQPYEETLDPDERCGR